jgi:hypothetical protein
MAHLLLTLSDFRTTQMGQAASALVFVTSRFDEDSFLRNRYEAFFRESALPQVMLDFSGRRLEAFFACLCIRWDSVRSGPEM